MRHYFYDSWDCPHHYEVIAQSGEDEEIELCANCGDTRCVPIPDFDEDEEN